MATASPPEGLVRLARHYDVRPVVENATWFARLPDGRLLPWAGAADRTYAERLRDPVLADMFSLPYVPGPIVPVMLENHDPGRIRVERLFEVVYGASPRDVSLSRIQFAGHAVKVHTRVKTAFLRVAARLDVALGKDPALRRFVQQLGGTLASADAVRIAPATVHRFGIAIDLDPSQGTYWESDRRAGRIAWRNNVSQPIVDAFEAEGFLWGGRWYHYETMHFEYRPELVGAKCAAG
jgi:hypothetical protein